MKELIEIRWHGRGGQGVVTAARFLAEVAIHKNMYGQGFPEFGPERMGAPIQAFTRISNYPILYYHGVSTPDIVAVLDDSLLDVVDVTLGIKEDGFILLNTNKQHEKIKSKFKGKIYTVDATGISIKILGKTLPNTPMIGALISVNEVIKLNDILEYFEKIFADKFSKDVIKGNLEAITCAFKEVKEL